VPDAPNDESYDLEQLIATLAARVEQRRRDGVYPPGLEQELDAHFARLTGPRPATPSFTMDEIEEAVADLRHFVFARESISTESKVPGGSMLHRFIAKAVARQIQGVLEQSQDEAQRVASTIALLAGVTNTLADAYDQRVLQQLDDLQRRLAEQQRERNVLAARLDEIAARVPGVALDTWYTDDAFTAAFRGDEVDIHARYGDLAALFEDCGPVLDIGFGRGEFLELLRDLGIDAMGIEVDPGLVHEARARGLRAEEGRAVEYLRAQPDGSLGGVVMIQVIEHLTPQHVVDIVKVIADKVRPGGRVVIETVNPMSMYTYAHALWVDPDHVRPVHPNFLQFLFAEAGFRAVERVDRGPVPANESLEMLPGDDEQTKRLNMNFERVNALLFAPQDYAIVASR
jgi:2-polyprenyl-3-methyl-5-hydroxy-6-metoxy-1,4-benzoquinol methylase